MRRTCAGLIAIAMLSGCSVWPVNQDPAGMNYRREANQVINALQDYRKAKGTFPPTLAMLTPGYLSELPSVPDLRYRVRDGSLSYFYIPSWPQLRPVRCTSEGNTTIWRCVEALSNGPM
jgi:hypothetical protein